MRSRKERHPLIVLAQNQGERALKELHDDRSRGYRSAERAAERLSSGSGARGSFL